MIRKYKFNFKNYGWEFNIILLEINKLQIHNKYLLNVQIQVIKIYLIKKIIKPI